MIVACLFVQRASAAKEGFWPYWRRPYWGAPWRPGWRWGSPWRWDVRPYYYSPYAPLPAGY